MSGHNEEIMSYISILYDAENRYQELETHGDIEIYTQTCYPWYERALWLNTLLVRILMLFIYGYFRHDKEYRTRKKWVGYG